MREHKYTIQTTGGEYVRVWRYDHEVGIREEHFPLEPYGDDYDGMRGDENAEMGRLRRRLSEDGISYHTLDGERGWVPAENVEAIHFGEPNWANEQVKRTEKL